MNYTIAIDPGHEQSAFVQLYGDGKLPELGDYGILENAQLLRSIETWAEIAVAEFVIEFVIEKIASYGMAVGAEVFETCVWTGRFLHAIETREGKVTRIPRIDVKGQICRDSRAKDSNVRQALIDRYGGPSTVKKGGVLHGVSKDVWAALAVGVTYWETRHLPNLI